MQIAHHLQQIQQSYIREILSAATAEGVISLAGGLPASDHFPLTLAKEAIHELAQHRELFQYGETAGYQPLIEYLRLRDELDSGQQVLVTSGSQQGLDLIARAFLNPGDGVAVEAPSYLGALQVFELARANIHSVPQTENGPDLEALEALLASGKVKMFYAVADFHNPTGAVWPLKTRLQVAELCRYYKIGLIEDAPYRELRFTGETLPMLCSFYPEGTLVLRSYSKIAFPGIRLATVSGPKQWIEPLIKVKQASDLHTAIPMQSVLLKLLSHPDFYQHLQQLRRLYKERYQTLASALESQLGCDFSFQPIEGGMFLWLSIPGKDAMQVAQKALDRGVAVVPGDVFYPQRKNVAAALRLNFSNSETSLLKEAVKRLSRVLNQYSNSGA